MAERDSQQRLKVFISYSRRDSSPLAEELLTALEVVGFDAVLDRHDIAAAEDWEARLERLIQDAGSVIIILSPEAVKSPRCAWEVDKAIALSKRLIPIVGKKVEDADVPEPLRRLNYVFFTEGQSFAAALGQVANALRADLDWIREHTRLAEAARLWQQRGQLEAFLPRDDELTAAKAWKAARPSGAPEITDAQSAFIAAGIDAQAARDERERQQRDEFAQAQNARAEALGERDRAQSAQAAALADRERTVKTLQRRTVLGGIGAGVFSLGIGGLGYWTWLTQGRLRDERARADKAQAASLDAAITREADRTDIEGQLVAFAASPGQYAWDGAPGEETSPYTKRVLDELKTPSVSLQSALSAAGRNVLILTKSEQRPYLASDLNGDIYLRRKPSSRQCKAIVVAVDQVGKTRFANVLRDGTAWADYLRSCAFEVEHLVNPTHQQTVAAFDRIRFSASPQSRPVANTLLLFFFSGGGSQDGRDPLILFADSMSRNELIVRDKTMDVGALSRQMRDIAAASVLVLDTAFPDVDKRRPS